MISAESVKTLREKTGVGMLECKKALVEADGDMEKAIILLRERGLAAAAKKSDRDATEGRVFSVISGHRAAVVELACETDFVGKNDQFIEAGNSLVRFILDSSIHAVAELEKAQIDGKPFPAYLSELILRVGENIRVRNLQLVEAKGTLSDYIHLNGKIGVVVAFSGTVDPVVAREIAMQVAASHPLYVRPSDVPQAEIQKESDIVAVQLRNEGKPEALIEQITKGKISKYFKEVCLLEQPFIKDDKKTVTQVLPKDVTVERFVRFSLA